MQITDLIMAIGCAVSYRKNDNTSYSVIRGKFDRWAAEEAKKAGVVLVEETVVRELIKENKKNLLTNLVVDILVSLL